jgi:predicted enzyme related to lactoylglutathione lyase
MHNDNPAHVIKEHERGREMKKNKVVFFEVPASNFKKAKEFYERVFDWNVELWGDDGAMAYTTAVDKDENPVELGGINGGFYKRKSKKDQPSFGMQTGSIDETLKAVKKAGGKVITPKTLNWEWGLWRTSQIRGNVIALWEKPKK